MLPLTSDLALRAVLLLASISAIISSAEFLARPQLLADDALASWPVNQLRTPWLVGPAFRLTLGYLLPYPRVLVFIAVRLAAALAIFSGYSWAVTVAGAWLVSLTTIVLLIRAPYGYDGADQMVVIIFLSVAVAGTFAGKSGQVLPLWLIGAQAILAYATSGIAKLSSSIWRSGAALVGVMRTRVYGHAALARWFAGHPRMQQFACWGIMAFECTFPLVLLNIPPLTLAILCSAFLFHLIAAVFMRLNTFFWSFTATYPAVLYCATNIPALLQTRG